MRFQGKRARGTERRTQRLALLVACEGGARSSWLEASSVPLTHVYVGMSDGRVRPPSAAHLYGTSGRLMRCREPNARRERFRVERDPLPHQDMLQPRTQNPEPAKTQPSGTLGSPTITRGRAGYLSPLYTRKAHACEGDLCKAKERCETSTVNPYWPVPLQAGPSTA